MITVDVAGKEYTIKQCHIVSDGPAKEYLEDCVYVAMKEYRDPADGFAEPFLFTKLASFRSIKPKKIEFKKQSKEDLIY